jgi:16S rRNA (guanine966-N2)-methyltransferase
LAFEAVSRGATNAVLIEQDRTAQKTIVRNIAVLGLEEQAKFIKASVGAWLHTSEDMFDIVLCDPPYTDLPHDLIHRLAERVKPGGLLVLSWPVNGAASEYAGYELVAQRTHGDMQLIFYRRTGIDA